MEMLYNNYLMSQMINIIDVRKYNVGNRVINSTAIPNRNGEIFQGAYFGTKSIEVDFYIKKDYLPTYLDGSVEASDFNKFVQSIAFYLYNNDAPAKLFFSDNPNQYHLAITESFDIERTLKLGRGTIVFKCFSPYTYDINPTSFSQDSTTKILTIENNGTANVYPILTTTLTADATHLAYVSTTGVVQIGDPNAKVEHQNVSNPKIHTDLCVSTSNWYVGSPSLLYSGRAIDENVYMVSDGNRFKLNGNPTGEENDKTYHGRFYMTNLPEKPKYWSTRINFTFMSTKSYGTFTDAPEQQGMIEFILYDENNQTIGSFSMRDFYPDYEHNIPYWFLGATQKVWSETGTLGTIKTKTQAQYFDSLDDVPTDAHVIYETAYPKKKVVISSNGTPIRATASPSAKIIAKVGQGATYEYAGVNYAGWWKIYMNSDKTVIGWVANYHATMEDDGTHYLVTYSTPVDSTSDGNWNNFTGTVDFKREKHPNGTGSIWKLGLYKKTGTNSSNGKITHQITKEIYDPDNKYTRAGNLSKIGVYIASYQNATIPQYATLDDVVVYKFDDSYFGESLKTIGNAGDVIEVNMEEQMVYKNGEEFMEHVDVGSRFFDVKAFTSSQVKVITDDSGATTTAEITKRYI